jgi:hypothetical protein
MIRISLLFVAMLLFTVAGAQTIKITTADGNGADCYITNDSQSEPNNYPDTYHGGEEQLKMRNLEGTRLKLILLRFDVSEISDVKDAVVNYNVTWYKGVDTKVYIYGLVNEDLDNWSELETCYDNAPGFVPSTEGIPLGYYDITDDLMLVGSADYSKNDVPDSSGLGWYTSNPSDTMDTFINSDTNGLITLALIPDPGPDADWAWSSKEDSVIYAPRLTGMSGATNISIAKNMIPSTTRLLQNYPNPFNPVTNIEFTLTKSGYITLEIYNTLGQLVATLIDQQMSSGHYRVSFTADEYTSGVYFYKLTSDNFTEVKKMMYLK